MSKAFLLVFLSCLIQCPLRFSAPQKRPREDDEVVPSQKRASPLLHRCLVDQHDFVKEGCACNFMGACSLDSNNEYQSFNGILGTIDTYIPNVTQFAKEGSPVVKICEPGKLGIIYDCENRIPLAASIVLTKNDYESVYSTKMRKKYIGNSKIINRNYRQRADDYKGSLTHKPCYRNIMGQIVYEQDWYRALTNRSVGVNVVCRSVGNVPRASIDRGHLIAAQYGRGGRVAETFLYTNIVPQFEKLNRGDWSTYECFLMKWAKKYCNGFPLHVIVGCVPSTFRKHQPRFLGKAGFSNYQGAKESDEYFTINVPSLMWTVACCGSGNDAHNTGFYAMNIPKREQVKPISPSRLIPRLVGVNSGEGFNFFPQAQDDCQNDDKYKDIKTY